MNSHEIIKATFKSFIMETFKTNEELRNYYLNHPRLTVAIDNLTKEIRIVELGGAVKLNKENIEDLSKEFCSAFCKISLAHHEQENETALSRSIKVQKHDENKMFEEMFNEEVKIDDRSLSLDWKS